MSSRRILNRRISILPERRSLTTVLQRHILTGARRALLPFRLFKRRGSPIVLFVLCVCLAMPLFAQSAKPSVIGNYGGKDIQWFVKFHISQISSGALTGTADIVDIGLYAVPCTDVALKGRHLTFSVPAIQGKFDGEVAPDGTRITGTWTQGAPRSLELTRLTTATAKSLRAQLAQVETLVASEFAKNPIGSVTIGVVSGTKLIWTRSYGAADMGKHVLADSATVYRIGSVTKMFTGLMLDQLVEIGTVHLSDPVRKYFPEISAVQDKFPNAPPITLMELATHTSGLGREPDNMDWYDHGATRDWEKQLIAALPQLHFAADPGTRYIYSNIGYAALGEALSRAAEQPYLSYIPSHIFKPLGMTHTALELTPEAQPHLAKGYEVTADGVDTATPLREQAGRGYRVPNGAAYTTVGDLAKFASFLMGNGPDEVLKINSLHQDLDQVIVPANSRMTEGYGLGFMVRRRTDYVAFGHGGDLAGYQAALYIHREKSLGVILLANARGSSAINSGNLALQSLDLLSK